MGCTVQISLVPIGDLMVERFLRYSFSQVTATINNIHRL